MENVPSAQAAGFTPACVKLPAWAACLPAPGHGRVAPVTVRGTGPSAAEGTGMPRFGRTPIRNPYIYKTRVGALGGGAVGPHPAREPEPV